MKKEELLRLKGTDCKIWLDVGMDKPFHYAGRVIDVRDSILILLDGKTSQRMNFNLSAIISVTELRGSP